MRRRFPETNMAERRLAERALEYDRALRRSQNVAVLRRKTTGKSGSLQSGPSDSHGRSGVASKTTAMTLGSEDDPFPKPKDPDDIPPEDYMEDGGVGSELGESYVDGKVVRGRVVQQSTGQTLENDQAGEGGMLGLLTQIYGTRVPAYTKGL